MKKYFLKLDNCGNIDIGQNPSCRIFGTTGGEIYVDSLQEAKVLCRAYIDAYELGGGNWTGGTITDSASKEEIGYVAYNGRIFDISNGKKTTDFIEINIPASENIFFLPPVKHYDYEDIVKILIEKAKDGIDVFKDGDTWVGVNSPTYDSPLGFDINVFEGETGGLCADIYSLTIENGLRGVGASGLGFYEVNVSDVKRIKNAYSRFLSSGKTPESNSVERLFKQEDKNNTDAKIVSRPQ